MRKNYFILLILLIAPRLFAQEIKNEKDRKMFVEFIYEAENETFNSGKINFVTYDYDPHEYFSTVMSEGEKIECLNLMKNTARLSFDNERIYFSANILTILNDAQRFNSLRVTKHENKLFYGKDSLKILNAEGGGNNIGNDYYQITLNYPLGDNQTETDKIKGSLIMKVDFLTGYDSVSLTPKDVGKKVTLASEIVEIVNIHNNAILLKGDTKNVQIVNFVSPGKVAKNVNHQGEAIFSLSSHTSCKSFYENIVLKKMSLKDFDKLMTIEKLNEIMNEEPYRVLKTASPIENQFVLYKPIYSTSYFEVVYAD